MVGGHLSPPIAYSTKQTLTECVGDRSSINRTSSSSSS